MSSAVLDRPPDRVPSRATRFFAGPVRSVYRSPTERWARRLLVLIVLIWPIAFVAGFGTAVMALTIVGFVASIGGLKNGSLGVLGIGLLCTLEPLTQVVILTGGIFRWNTVNYWLLIVMLLNLPFLLRRSDLQSRLLQGYLLVLAVGLLWTPDTTTGVQQILETLVPFGLLVYFWRASSDEEVWTWLAFTNGTLAALGGLVFFAVGADLLDAVASSESVFNPNAVDFLPLCGLFSICLGIPRASSKGQFVLALLAVINAGWVFLAGSRGGILVGIICLLFILARMRGARRRAFVLGACAIIGVSVYITFHDRVEHSIERISELVDPAVDPASRTSGRTDLLVGGLRIFESHPWLGVGTGGFRWYWVRLHSGEGMALYAVGKPKPAHAGWIRTLSENGVLGIVFHVAYVLSFVFIGWRKRRQGLFSLGLFVTCVLAAAYVATEMQLKGPWFLAMAATAIFYRPRAETGSRVVTETGVAPSGRLAGRLALAGVQGDGARQWGH